jgi:nonribosomal peptide synthetase protein BlmIII
VKTDDLASVALPATQQELVDSLNSTAAPVPEQTLDDLLAIALRGAPERSSVVAPRLSLTRGELHGRIAALAGQLRGHGIGPGSTVVLCAELGWEQVAGAAEILRTGATVLPVPPALPQTVRWDAVQRGGAKVVVTQWWQVGRTAWPAGVELVTIADEPPAAALSDEAVTISPDATAVLLPDADQRLGQLALTHRTIANALLDVNRRLGLAADDRVLALAPAHVGASLPETFGPLLAGATVVFGQDIDAEDPKAWLERMTAERVTVWFTTPTLLDRLLDHLAGGDVPLPPALRAVVLAGERLSLEQVRELRAAAKDDLAVAYATGASAQGPWVAWHDLPADADAKVAPLGRPMAHQRLFVLSETLSPCPVWVTGRVYVGGLAAQGETVPHPATGEPLMATPLYGRLVPQGVIEAVGDDGSRITVHGRSLNLRDAEIALAAHPAVRGAAVVAAPGSAESVALRRRSPSAADVQLGGILAFVWPRTGVEVTVEDLVAYLRRKVSPYLLPARIDLVGQLPVADDGRADRAALLASVAATRPEAPAAPQPSTLDVADAELTRRVTAIACRLFDVSAIEPNVNLMDIGATSYQLVRLATVIEEELGFTPDVEELLRFPSIAVIVSSHVGSQPTGPKAGQRSSELIVRQAFKDEQHGIRHEWDDSEGLALPGLERPAVGERRTSRTFDPSPVRLAALGTLLGALRAEDHDGELRHRYPSAGSAYPVQTYLLVAPGRVSDLAAGSYYYHPVRDRLVPIDPDATLPASAHADINRAAYRECAFSLYLVGRMPAIDPLYPEQGWDFTVFEAGAMTQLLAMVAAECGLGLCPIGALDTTALPGPFRLGEGDRFVHALLGGNLVAGGH